MLEGRDDTLYLAAFELNAISRFDAASKKTTPVIQDPHLQWPGTWIEITEIMPVPGM